MQVFKLFKIALCCVVLLSVAAPVFAQGEDAQSESGGEGPVPFIDLSNYFGAGLIVIGAGLGIGKIGAAATDNIARQPEVAGNVQTAMIIAAALIEGATFFGLIICMLF